MNPIKMVFRLNVTIMVVFSMFSSIYSAKYSNIDDCDLLYNAFRDLLLAGKNNGHMFPQLSKDVLEPLSKLIDTERNTMDQLYTHFCKAALGAKTLEELVNLFPEANQESIRTKYPSLTQNFDKTKIEAAIKMQETNVNGGLPPEARKMLISTMRLALVLHELGLFDLN